MNEWKVTAILKNDAVVVEQEGDQTINFTAVHTEKLKDTQGNYTRPIRTFIDCQWIVPDLTLLPKLKDGALVYMRGKPYLRPITRLDKTTSVNLAMTVTEIVKLDAPPEKGL